MGSDNLKRTYTYIRTLMVGLLISLGVAVFFEAWRQGEFLSSVSAYYYSPAQSIFVGNLIALAACMVALRGTNRVEDVFLNLGGVCAVFVAIVPTSRGSDHQSAIKECLALAGKADLDQLKCPDMLALEAATRANVENNMIAVLVLGALGLVAALLFARRDDRGTRRRPGRIFWCGWTAAALVWAGALGVRLAYIGWAVENLHLAAALGLLVCIVVVASANAVRRNPGRSKMFSGVYRGGDRYMYLAAAMIAFTGAGTGLLFQGVITLFYLEIGAALLFALFWMVQTVEQL